MYQITADDINFCDRYTYKLCRRLGRLPDDDAYQAGREGMVIASHKFNPEKSNSFKGFSTWWIRHNLYRNHYGMNGKSDALKKSVVFYEEVCYLDDDREGSAADMDLAETCLELMTEKQRAVMVAVAIEGKTRQEVADEMGCQPQNITQIYQDARDRVKRKLRRKV